MAHTVRINIYRTPEISQRTAATQETFIQEKQLNLGLMG